MTSEQRHHENKSAGTARPLDIASSTLASMFLLQEGHAAGKGCPTIADQPFRCPFAHGPDVAMDGVCCELLQRRVRTTRSVFL